METVMYSVKIKEHSKVFAQTVALYRAAVDFFTNVIYREWEQFVSVMTSKQAVNLTENLTVSTASHPSVPYSFSTRFYKFPSYLRRAAIAEAYGKVSSYYSHFASWKMSDPKTRGGRPVLGKTGFIYPAMYRYNCFVRTGTYTAKLKVFVRNTWDWISVKLRKSDVDYIRRHCASFKECVPTLQKRGKQWYLDFAFQYKTDLHKIPVSDQTILAVDLGINNCCTCAVMRSDGAVIGRYFLKLPKEYDCLKRKINRIRYAQCHGSHNVHNLWRLADGVNKDIASKTAAFIVDTAVQYNADTVVFEYLDLTGKKRGSKKQRLSLWRAKDIQSIVENRCHRFGMRISRICAWGTSKYAVDGSGKVLRGKDSTKTNGSYSVCEFSTGKVYNCDLNASYNIGARYFIREILKSLSVTEEQRILANVPACAKRSTCTLSDLISLHAALYAEA